MFSVNDDMSIYLTRGDTAYFSVTLRDETNGNDYTFKAGDVVRFKVTEKKACENVIFFKDFSVAEDTKRVDLVLTEDETRIGEVISKPTDYWYEVELNPFTEPHTIIGYDDDGAKVLKLFPEGKDAEKEPIAPEDIPVVDEELDGTSTRPVENQAITKRFAQLEGMIKTYDDVIIQNGDTSIFVGSATMLGGLPAEKYVKEEKFNEVTADLKKSVSDGKEEIADAITSKGVNTAIDLSHHELAQNILKIKAGQGDALPVYVLEGCTFTNESGELLVGTMPDMSMEWGGRRVEKDGTQLLSIFDYGYRSPEYDFENLAMVIHPLSEVNEVTGFTDYKNAVVDGLANSGLGVTEETSADELQGILEGKFPASQDILAHLLADEGYSQSSEHFDGSVTKGDTLNIFCSSDSSNRQDNCYVKLKGKDKYSMSSCLLSFNVEYNKGKEEGAGVDGDLNYAIIRVCNDTGEIAKWEKVGIIDVGTFADTLSFTSGGEWWVEIEVSTGSDYTNAIFNINSMVVEAKTGSADLYGDFWDGFVKDRTEWAYVFQGWGHEYIRPTIQIKPTSTVYSFYGCSNLKVVEKKYFDFSNATPSETTNSTGNNRTFSRCNNLEHIEDIGMPSGYNLRTYEMCYKLHTIDVLRSTIATIWSNTFTGCTSLAHIGQVIGVIGTDIDLKNAPLDLPSAIEVLTKLANHSGTDKEFTYTVAFSTITWEYLNASTTSDGGSWEDYIESKGFNY